MAERPGLSWIGPAALIVLGAAGPADAQTCADTGINTHVGFDLAVRHDSGPVLGSYSVADGEILGCSIDNAPPVPSARLYLVNVSGVPEFRAVHDALAAMSFYNFNPETLKVPQKPDAGDLLHRDGSNLASAIARLKAERPDELERITQYLAAIVPGCPASTGFPWDLSRRSSSSSRSRACPSP
jgi:hypothetical protein